MKTRAVLLCDKDPGAADAMHEAIKGLFDCVEVFCLGENRSNVPSSLTAVFKDDREMWLSLFETNNFDVTWMVGEGVQFVSKPVEIMDVMMEALPFGVWSPAVSDTDEHMSPAECGNAKFKVKVSSPCIALSKELMGFAAKMPSDGYTCKWFCDVGSMNGLDSFIDGRVSMKYVKPLVSAPGAVFAEWLAGAVAEREKKMSSGKPFVIATIDNGCGLAAFERIAGKVGNVKTLVMVKGIGAVPLTPNRSVVPYDPELKGIIEGADAAFFPSVICSAEEDVSRLVGMGFPCVVNIKNKPQNLVHEKNGLVYQHEDWAVRWLTTLKNDKSFSERFKSYAEPKAVPSVHQNQPSVKTVVTIVTPTFRRSPNVIKRCIDCVRLQTMQDWEMLVVSNGPKEALVESLVTEVADARIRYMHCDGAVPMGDYGNHARTKAIKEANGEFIAFVDDDNLVLPDFLNAMLDALRGSPDSDFAVCDIVHFGPLNEAELGKPPVVLKGEPVKLYYVDPLQVVVKTSVMKEIGWDTERGYLSDGVTLERLGNGRKHVKVDKVLGFHL